MVRLFTRMAVSPGDESGTVGSVTKVVAMAQITASVYTGQVIQAITFQSPGVNMETIQQTVVNYWASLLEVLHLVPAVDVSQQMI